LLKIKLNGRRGILGEDVEVSEHVTDGAIAMAGVAFRAINRFVEREFATGIGAECVQETADFVLRSFADNQSSRRNCAGVDHGIARAAGARFEADRVEGITRRFHADFADHLGPAIVFESHSVNEWFRNGLNRESLPRVARFIDRAAGGYQANAKPIRVGFGQFRDVRGDFPLSHARKFVMQILYVILYRGGRGQLRFTVQGSP